MYFWPRFRNFTLGTERRNVIDSDNYWRPEWHPQFNLIFAPEDFIDIFAGVNGTLSELNRYSDEVIETFGSLLYAYLSPHRFIAIPKKYPTAPQAFLAYMYAVINDILPEMAIDDYPLTLDDLHDHIGTIESGKSDTARIGAKERTETGDERTNQINAGDSAGLSQQNTSNTETVDEQSKQNTTVVADNFLSPQNVGALPVSANRPEGVEGVENAYYPTASVFVTNKQVGTTGDTSSNGSQQQSQGMQADENVSETTGGNASAKTTGMIGAEQNVENQTTKDDKITARKDFNLVSKLADVKAISSDRHFMEIFARASEWILTVDLPTTRRDYRDCTFYPDGV